MVNIIWVVFCLLGIPLGIGLLIGWFAWGRARNPRPLTPSTRPENHEAWLAQQIDREPLRSVLTVDQREQLREIYLPGTMRATASAAEDTFETADHLDPALLPATSPVDAETPEQPLTISEPSHDFEPSPLAASTPRPPRPVRDPLDPAALMLYLGAFLVVAAGLVYAAYNWADLAGWQKTGMLGAFTIAFAATGWLLLGNSRVRQAAETLVAVGALLLPANAIAIWSVVQNRNASTAIIVLLGAAITSVVYALFSIRPGGIVYRVGATSMMWLAISAVPSAVGFHWGWGAPLVISAVGARWAFPRSLPKTLRHLEPSLQTTSLVALSIAVLVGLAGSLDTTPWLAPITLAMTTIALSVYAHRRLLPVWGVAATIAACLTVASILTTLDDPSAWILALLPLGTALALIAIGERGPQWLRSPLVRLALHIEALIALLSAMGGAEGMPWLRVAVLMLAIAATALIARLRDARWWLLATGSAALLCWTAIAAAIGTDPTWSATDIVLFVAVFVVIASVAAYTADRWSERSHRPAWGEPLWLTAGSAAIFIPVFVFTNRSFDNENAPWLVLAAVSLVFAGLALVAAWSVDRLPVRIIAGLLAVAATVAASFVPDISLEDRLPLVVGLLLILLGIDWLLLGRHHPILIRISPRRADQPLLEQPVLVVAAGVVLTGMAALIARYVITNSDSDWASLPSVRWTWITDAIIFAGVTGGLGLLSLRLDNRPGKPLWRTGPSAIAFVTSGAGLTLILSTLLIVRMLTTNGWAPMLALTLVAWLLITTAMIWHHRERFPRATPWWRGVGLATGVLAVLHPLLLSSSWDDGDGQLQIMVVALVSLAGLVALTAWDLRSRLQAIGASAIAMLALLIQIGLQDPPNVLAFSLPLGVYLLALGTINRRTPHLRDGLLAASAGVLLLPSLGLAQQGGQVRYLLLASGLSLALFLGGLALRLRVPIAAGLLGITIIVLRLLIDAVLALQSWVALLVVGLLLIGGGTASLIWQDALRARLAKLQRSWHDMN